MSKTFDIEVAALAAGGAVAAEGRARGAINKERSLALTSPHDDATRIARSFCIMNPPISVAEEGEGEQTQGQ